MTDEMHGFISADIRDFFLHLAQEGAFKPRQYDGKIFFTLIGVISLSSRNLFTVSLHLAEKQFPENHLPGKHFPKRSFSRINICQKSHLPE